MLVTFRNTDMIQENNNFALNETVFCICENVIKVFEWWFFEEP